VKTELVYIALEPEKRAELEWFAAKYKLSFDQVVKVAVARFLIEREQSGDE
jgi:hypothetical protein